MSERHERPHSSGFGPHASFGSRFKKAESACRLREACACMAISLLLLLLSTCGRNSLNWQLDRKANSCCPGWSCFLCLSLSLSLSLSLIMGHGAEVGKREGRNHQKTDRSSSRLPESSYELRSSVDSLPLATRFGMHRWTTLRWSR